MTYNIIHPAMIQPDARNREPAHPELPEKKGILIE